MKETASGADIQNEQVGKIHCPAFHVSDVQRKALGADCRIA